MYARLSALVSLLSIGTVGATAGGLGTTSSGEVQLYLRSGGDTSPTVLSEMKTNLIWLLGSAGLRTGWWSTRDRFTGVDGDLIIVDLQGTCDPRASAADLTGKNPTVLASTAVADGRILPFSSVDCGAVNRFLADSLAALADSRRERVYGRALARLLAHEIYHVITKSMEHAPTGIAKARVTPEDLIGEHFDFDGLTLARPSPQDQTASDWQPTPELDADK